MRILHAFRYANTTIIFLTKILLHSYFDYTLAAVPPTQKYFGGFTTGVLYRTDLAILSIEFSLFK